MLHFLRIKEYRRCTALGLCHTIYDAPPWPEIRIRAVHFELSGAEVPSSQRSSETLGAAFERLAAYWAL